MAKRQKQNVFDRIYMTNFEKVTHHLSNVCICVCVGGSVLTALSMPSVNSMIKKITAHTDDPGNVAMASG